MANILIVEDDPNFASIVKDLLKLEHHVVECVDNGHDGQHMLQVYTYDLIILDWELPDATGIDLCKQFRSAGGLAPVLFLTGKQTPDEKEEGFDAGADDYVTKPFNPKELRARVRALLRRPPNLLDDKLRVADLEMCPRTYNVTRGGASLQLTPREFVLLEFLMRHPNEAFTVEAFMERVWTSQEDCSPEAVRTCIKRLRQKLDKTGAEPLIETIHGVGYRLNARR